MAQECFNHYKSSLGNIFSSSGFEIHPFKIGWYNDEVDEQFKFQLDPDTLAFLVVSTPDMFESALVPHILKENCIDALDPLDRCMKHYFGLAKSAFPKEDVEIIHDFELTPTRRPRILVQPAGHVSGAAYYYTRKSLNPDPFEPKKKIYGVSIHPKYGGWFALRGILLFKSVQCPNLPRVSPKDCIPDNDKKVELLKLFNYHWKDWRFRDIISSEKKYSEDQKVFFSTSPKDREPLMQNMKQKWLIEKNVQGTEV